MEAAASAETAKLSCDVCAFELGEAFWLYDSLGADAQFRLCEVCLGQQRFPDLFVPSDFKRVENKREVSPPAGAPWPEERQLEFVRAFREIGCDVKRLSELEARFGSSAEMLAKFLHYPLQHFRTVLRLSNNSIENLFKRKEKAPSFDRTTDDALLESLMLLRLLFDYAEEAPAAEQAGEEGSVQRAIRTFVEQHRAEILRVKEKLLRQSELAARREEQQMIEDVQRINALQMQKLEIKLRFLEEHEKILLEGEQMLLIQQNESLINAYLY